MNAKRCLVVSPFVILYQKMARNWGSAFGIMRRIIGIEVDVISHQATSVKVAVGGFVENLIESVVLVIAVLLFTMGLRSGLLIGGVLLLTVLATVFVMDLFGIMFERISLGAFIIALGMLVNYALVYRIRK